MPRAPTYGVPLGEIFREAFANLRARGQRSALALLGIVVGTASIITMLNIGHIAQRESMKHFERLGVDTVQVQGMPNGGPAVFDLGQVAALPGLIQGVADATPYATQQLVASANGKSASVAVLAAPPSMAGNLNLAVQSGRLLTDIDHCAQVAVIGYKAASALSARPEDILGKQVGLGGYLYTVVGVLAPTAEEQLSLIRYNDLLFIPLACARRVVAGSGANSVLVKLFPDSDVDWIDSELKLKLANKTTTIQTVNAKQIITTMNRQKGLLAAVLAAIGGISLLVGGIGVMNVMLMNVLERRREIGLRAAIGATPRDIQTMFLVEAAILAATGGLAGTLLGIVISAGAVSLFKWEFAVAYHLLPIGPVGAGLIGVLFGLYPALSASRIDPIEALRAD